jgi:hypothetical protein
MKFTMMRKDAKALQGQKSKVKVAVSFRRQNTDQFSSDF